MYLSGCAPGAVSYLSGCAPGALPLTMGRSAGLPVADNQYSRKYVTRGLAHSTLLLVKALQCRSLAYLQQCQQAPEPYTGCPESCLGATATVLPASRLCHTSGHVWLLTCLYVPYPGRAGCSADRVQHGECMRAHLSSCVWRPGWTFLKAVCARAGSGDTLLTLPGHLRASHDGAPGDDVAATTTQPPPCLTVMSPNNRPITSSVSVVRPCWAIVQNTSEWKANKLSCSRGSRMPISVECSAGAR